MSENKFIKHLKGEDTAKSVLEIKNQRTKTSFANMPEGTSNANDVYSDHRGNATGVLRGADNWKLSNASSLVGATTLYGDGRDFIDSFNVSGNGLWVDATYTFATPKIFNPNTKFVLKLCGERLSDTSDTVPFSLVVTVGNLIVTKSFVIREHAFSFAEEFVIDFAESNSAVVKCAAGSTMRVQLLCGSANASATLYNGMTVFTALQRRVDSDVVASDTKTFEDVVNDVEQLQEDLDDLEEYVDDTFVKLDGSSIMTGPLKMRASISFQCAIAPFWDGVGFYKLNSDDSVTLIASIEDPDGFIPWTTNTYNIGSSVKKWKNLYLAGKAFVATINNGADLTVPNKSGTLATMGDVELAARSGRMLTDQGVWFAKMYSATVVPTGAQYDGTNYADFSQVDGDNNPVIKIYTGASGAWTLTETITPPAEYDGYVPITKKIWDIAEQTGQQGGRVLWNHQSKEFTPYPLIVSFEDIEITGDSTVIMPLTPSINQIVNKDYVDTLVSNSIGDATITLTQGGQTMGSFTTNQSGDATIALDGGSSYHPDLFDWKWADHQLNDVQWLRADTWSWQSGAVYEVAYQHLVDDAGLDTPEFSEPTQDANLSVKSWDSACWDGTKFIVLCQDGYISTSTDGTTWTTATRITNLGSLAWTRIVYGGSKFVALSYYGYTSTSTDGTTWTSATLNLHSNKWSGLAYGGTKFVALGYDGYISTSTDGTTWTTPAQNANLGTNKWYGLAYDGTKFVALGYDGHISTSTDGTTWTVATQNANLGNNRWRNVVYDGAKFVALGQFGYVSSSPDGTTWTVATLDENLNIGNTPWWLAIVCDGTRFIAFGSRNAGADLGYVSTASSAVIETETIAGTTITYFTATDGHKIVLADQENNVNAIYTATGVAWYYILDMANQRFKLPRTKFGVTGLRDTVGDYVEPALPNLTGSYNFIGHNPNQHSYSGVFKKATVGSMPVNGLSGGGSWNEGWGTVTQPFDASNYDTTYKNGATVQPKATQMYLYFYVGEFTQTALENTAGINAETLNDKVGVDLDTVSAAGKATAAVWALPDWQHPETLNVSIKGSTYTATKNGYYVIDVQKDTASAVASIRVNGINVAKISISASWEEDIVVIPACVGDVFSSAGSVYGATITDFIPLKAVSA